MNITPTLSIIIPVYNIENYIQDCLDCVVPQLSSNTELILVNDGSTDRSSQICSELAINNEFITYLTKSNGGVSSARNYGLRYAKGLYILFIDGDDTIYPKSISRILNKIEVTDADAITNSEFIRNYRNINIITKLKKNRYINKIEKSEGYDAYENLLKSNFFIPSMWNLICKKDLYIKENIKFDERLINNEDVLCAMQLLLVSRNISILREPHYKYRLNRPNSATKQFNRRRIESSELYINKFIKISDNITHKNLKKELFEYLGYQYLILIGSLYLTDISTILLKRDSIKNLDWLVGRVGLKYLIPYSLLGFEKSGKILSKYIKYRIKEKV